MAVASKPEAASYNGHKTPIFYQLTSIFDMTESGQAHQRCAMRRNRFEDDVVDAELLDFRGKLFLPIKALFHILDELPDYGFRNERNSAATPSRTSQPAAERALLPSDRGDFVNQL